MAPRAYWKGYLKLSLVSCPIALYPAASSSERVSFNRINRKTGNRLKQQNVDSESNEPVDKEDIGRGYEVAKGQYIQVEDDELEKIQIESTHTIEIDSFVPRAEIDERYLDSSYYIAPTDQVGQEAFAVIRNAIRDRKMVGLGRVVLARRERVVMLEAFDKGLLATTLRYAYEVRDAGVYFEDIPDLKLPKEMSDLAGHIIDTKASHFDPAKFEDHYENALVELLRKKQAGRVIEPIREEAPPPQRVINLMDALRASLGTEAEKKPAAPSAKARTGGRTAKGTTSGATGAGTAAGPAAKGAAPTGGRAAAKSSTSVAAHTGTKVAASAGAKTAAAKGTNTGTKRKTGR
jgi:DNA end-binding protein Ku